MQPSQIHPPGAEEFEAYCLGKAAPERAMEIEAYLAAHPDWTPVSAAGPDDPLFRHLRGATELSRSSAPPAISGYELLEELGRGGMGVVYKARHKALNRLVALKMILTGGFAAPEERNRFRREAETGARLQHPQIVQVYEVGIHEGLPFLSLEYVEGGALAQKTAGAPLPAKEAAALVEVLARAVDYAHQNGVIHRDLKPANILLSPKDRARPAAPPSSSFVLSDWSPKITDFGLAKCLEEQEGQTASNAIMGTPHYMAPEQARGDTKQIGPLADVYALGAILYELLTGKPPFLGASVLDVLEQVRSMEPVAPSRLVPRLPRDLETICLECLQKDQAKRYNSARALADDLRRYLEGRPILARPVSGPERVWRWCRRNPRVAVLSGTALLLLLGWAITMTGMTLQVLHEQNEKEGQRQAAVEAQGVAEEAQAEEEKARRQEAQQAEFASKQNSNLLGAIGKLVIEFQNRLGSGQDHGLTRDEVTKLRTDLLEMARAELDNVARTPVTADLIDRRKACAHQRLGNIYQLLGDTNKAFQEYGQALKQFQVLFEASPTSEVAQRDLSAAHYCLGAVRLQLGQRPEAERDFEAALKLRAALARKAPDSPQAQFEHALALARCGKHQLAAEVTDHFRAQAGKDGRLLYNASCCYAVCASAVVGQGTIGALPATEREQVERYRALSLAALEQAVARGCLGRVELRCNPDLEAVRSLPAFATLAAKVEQAARSSPQP